MNNDLSIPQNDNVPQVERTLWLDCFISVGAALLVVMGIFYALEQVLRAFARWWPL